MESAGGQPLKIQIYTSSRANLLRMIGSVADFGFYETIVILSIYHLFIYLIIKFSEGSLYMKTCYFSETYEEAAKNLPKHELFSGVTSEEEEDGDVVKAGKRKRNSQVPEQFGFKKTSTSSSSKLSSFPKLVAAQISGF